MLEAKLGNIYKHIDGRHVCGTRCSDFGAQLSHMFLESKTTSLIDSLEIASVKFLNAIVERPSQESPARSAA